MPHPRAAAPAHVTHARVAGGGATDAGPRQLYMSVDTSDDSNGVAGCLGFYGQVAAGSVTADGQVWTAVNFQYAHRRRTMAIAACAPALTPMRGGLGGRAAPVFRPLFSATQSVSNLGNGTSFLVGIWLDAIINGTEGDVCAKGGGRETAHGRAV